MAGDGLMAGFGLPLPADDASGRAVSAARVMIAGFGKLAAEWRTRLGIETGIGIGINAGDVIVGDVGAPELPSYTLIGDAVNVAARLVQRARAGEALFSLSVKQALDPLPQGVLELPAPGAAGPHAPRRNLLSRVSHPPRREHGRRLRRPAIMSRFPPGPTGRNCRTPRPSIGRHTSTERDL